MLAAKEELRPARTSTALAYRLAATVAAAFLLAACADAPTVTEPVGAVEARDSQGRSNLIPGRFIVILHDNANPAAIARDHEIEPHFVYSHLLKGFSGAMSEQAAAALRRNPLVRAVEPDGYVYTTTMTQSNPPWGLDRIDQREHPIDGSYRYDRTGAGVHVYVMDSGIRTTHSEFAGRIGLGRSFILVCNSAGKNCKIDPSVEDCMGHGTHVSGTIGGTTYGVAKGVTIVPVRVFACTGTAAWSAIFGAADWIAANAQLPAVVNMSLASTYWEHFNDVIEGLVARGISVVAAAANANTDACGYSPASAPTVITVGAMDSTDVRSSFSNWGDCVDVFAPGRGILSAIHTSDTASGRAGGTSMASPHVAGAVALYLQHNPAATPEQVRNALYADATLNVVTNSQTAKNHLLYVPLFGAAIPSIATTVMAISATSQDAPVGTAVSSPPSVLVHDQFGSPMAGVNVSFAVTAGGGFMDPSSALTGAEGIASAASWILGETEGGNTATAAVSGLAPVIFQAAGTAGSGDEPAGVLPVARFTHGCTGFTCSFTSTSSAESGIVSLDWSASNGSISTGETATFSGGPKQNLTVTLIVTDGAGLSASASAVIKCNPKFCQ